MVMYRIKVLHWSGIRVVRKTVNLLLVSLMPMKDWEIKKYLDAFFKTVNFPHKYIINHKTGEWSQLLNKHGIVIIDDLANPWEAIYHSVRAVLECKIVSSHLKG